ncbi:MAG: hypothetical protein JWR77_2451 [Rhizorhabdus sp.]|nr:hypothetical protein [Rhizorhabdus sp.]
MTSEKHGLIAFCAILAAICYLATIAAFLAYQQRYAEALGFGGITTGLVGVIGTFKPRTQGVSDEALQTAVDKIPPATRSGE